MSPRFATLMVGVSLAGCTPTPLSLAEDTAGAWQVLPHIKMAAFSRADPRDYDLMIFCEDDDHVRLYHAVPPDEAGSELVLRSERVSLSVPAER
jgi:hypothetical protein